MPCPHQKVRLEPPEEIDAHLSDGEDQQQPPEFGPDPLPPMPWFGMDIGGTLSKVRKTMKMMENNTISAVGIF